MFSERPTRFFLTAGRGDASNPLNAFDAALIDAGVGDTNLIKLSSILPPGMTATKAFLLPKGAFVPLAYAERVSDEPGQRISAAVAVGIPSDEGEAGLIMECSGLGDPDVWEQQARYMVIEGMEGVRKRRIKEIKSISATTVVKSVGAVFAGVILCP